MSAATMSVTGCRIVITSGCQHCQFQNQPHQILVYWTYFNISLKSIPVVLIAKNLYRNHVDIDEHQQLLDKNIIRNGYQRL